MNKLISAICSSLLLGVSLTTVHAQEFDRGIVLNTFIPKGQWVVGNSISYSEYSNDNYQFLVVENMDGIGYTFKVSPMFCYIVKDNLGLGGRFAYERSLTKLDNASIKIGDDLNFDMDNVYSLSHSYSGGVPCVTTSVSGTVAVLEFSTTATLFGWWRIENGKRVGRISHRNIRAFVQLQYRNSAGAHGISQ